MKHMHRWIWILLLAGSAAEAQPRRYFRLKAEAETEAAVWTAAGELVWSNANVSGRFQVQWCEDLAAEGWRDYVSGPATGVWHRVKLFDPAPPAGMTYVPAGDFAMGDGWGADPTAMPLHGVWVSAFYVDRHPVEKAEWDDVRSWGLTNGFTDLAEGVGGGRLVAEVVTNGSITTNWLTYPMGPEHPVVYITWYDMVKWCNARSLREGLSPVYYRDAGFSEVYRTGAVDLANSQVDWSGTGYRLPTEAEWEKAARGGLIQHHYAWPSSGANLGALIDGTRANYRYSGDEFEAGSTPGGYYDGGQVVTNGLGERLPGADMANAYGLYDVVGNVWEMCWDVFSATTYQWRVDSGDLADPRGPTYTNAPLRRCERGGSWRTSSLADLRIPGRWWWYPNDATAYLNRGFRTVRRAPEP